MQVATLFRESTSLLGAGMETGGANGQDQQLGLDGGYHHAKYSMSMKLEAQDDGYETSADLNMTPTAAAAAAAAAVAGVQDGIKCEMMEDPYSFIDEDNTLGAPSGHQVPGCLLAAPHVPKKRGRKKKIKLDDGDEPSAKIKVAKERKKHDRFNGMPEEEVSKRTLPDHLTQNLDILIIGINPGLFAAYKGHHYAGPGNHFWKCLYLSGLTPEQMSADEDYKLLQVGIGFTNMVQRPTKGSADLTRKEIKEGCQILLKKLQRFKPKIAVFNGKLIYEVFSGKKDFSFGRQPDLVDGTNTYMWVMPSSSARCAQLPRAADKVPFYAALKKFRDYLNGIVTSIDDSEVVFSDAKLKSCYESELRLEPYNSEIMDISNATKNGEPPAVPCKKKRGRPKKIKVEGEQPTPTVKPVRKPASVTANANGNNGLGGEAPKKKRGRPKKIKTEDSLGGSGGGAVPAGGAGVGNEPPSTPSCYPSQETLFQAGGYGYQSPRPQSQPLTHSDLSSEISAAISSESPAPASPSLGPADFEPPASMPEDPAGLEAYYGQQQQPQQQPQQQQQQQQQQYHPDMSTKSLSGLESLVDQIPSIAEGGPGGGAGPSPAGPDHQAEEFAYDPYHHHHHHQQHHPQHHPHHQHQPQHHPHHQHQQHHQQYPPPQHHFTDHHHHHHHVAYQPYSHQFSYGGSPAAAYPPPPYYNPAAYPPYPLGYGGF